MQTRRAATAYKELRKSGEENRGTDQKVDRIDSKVVVAEVEPVVNVVDGEETAVPSEAEHL